MNHHDTDIEVTQNRRHRLLNHRQPVLAGDPWCGWWSAAICTTRAFQGVSQVAYTTSPSPFCWPR